MVVGGLGTTTVISWLSSLGLTNLVGSLRATNSPLSKPIVAQHRSVRLLFVTVPDTCSGMALDLVYAAEHRCKTSWAAAGRDSRASWGLAWLSQSFTIRGCASSGNCKLLEGASWRADHGRPPAPQSTYGHPSVWHPFKGRRCQASELEIKLAFKSAQF